MKEKCNEHPGIDGIKSISPFYTLAEMLLGYLEQYDLKRKSEMEKNPYN